MVVVGMKVVMIVLGHDDCDNGCSVGDNGDNGGCDKLRVVVVMMMIVVALVKLVVMKVFL